MELNMILSKYDVTKLSYTVTLHRYYCGLSPSEVGTPAAYDQRLKELNCPDEFKKILLDGLDIHVHDMDDQKLDEEVARGQANLQNVYAGQNRPAASGSGLYWNRDKLQLAVYHDGWKADVSPSPKPIQAHNIEQALNTLAHELGHHYSWLIDFNRDKNYVAKELTKIIMGLMSPQAETPEENIAEHFRYLFGCKRTASTFSDGKRVSTNFDALRNAMIVALYAYHKINNRILSNMYFDGQRLFWTEHTLSTFWLFLIPIPITKTKKYSMGIDGVIRPE